MQQTLILVRGLPGSGKSTLAEEISSNLDNVHIEADMYFLDEDGKPLDYAKTVTKIEGKIFNTEYEATKGLIDYLTGVAESNTSDAATAKSLLNKIQGKGVENPVTSVVNNTISKITGVAPSTPMRNNFFEIDPIIEAIDPIKEGNEGLLKTKLGEQLVSYVEKLRSVKQSIEAAKIDLSKTKDFNRRVLDATMRAYQESNNSWVEDVGEKMYNLEYLPGGAGIFSTFLHKTVGWLLKPNNTDKQARETQFDMLKQSMLDPDGGLRSPQEIARDMNLKFGKDISIEYYDVPVGGTVFGSQTIYVPKMKVYYKNKLIQDGIDTPNNVRPTYEIGKKIFFEFIGDQGYKALNATAAEMSADPQMGLKISPNSPMTAGLGVFGTSVDGKLSVNNFKIAGEYKQTPTNMSYFQAYQTDIKSALDKVDQLLVGAPKISIGYDPKKLANVDETKIIKTLVRELYDEAKDPNSKSAFNISPLPQIGGSTDKRGYWFNNLPEDVVNKSITSLGLRVADQSDIKEKITTQGFTIYGDEDGFTSGLFDSYNIDPRYTIFASNKDDKGRPFYQEENRRGDASLNIQFDPVYNGYTATVDYRFFDPIKQVYKTSTVTNPVSGNVVTNGAQFTQLLREYDDMMNDVTIANIKAIISPESVIPQ